jgi:uncharacterized protein
MSMMKKILYLHGLESAQGGAKVDYLATKGIVHAPEMDYTRKDLFGYLIEVVSDFKPDLIIGSSMGGYCAYVLGSLFKIPLLVFNPALHSRKFEPAIPDFVKKHYPQKMHVVVGDEDTVINPNTTLDFITDKIAGDVVNITVDRIKAMGHRTTLDVFCNMYNKTV